MNFKRDIPAFLAPFSVESFPENLPTIHRNNLKISSIKIKTTHSSLAIKIIKEIAKTILKNGPEISIIASLQTAKKRKLKTVYPQKMHFKMNFDLSVQFWLKNLTPCQA